MPTANVVSGHGRTLNPGVSETWVAWKSGSSTAPRVTVRLVSSSRGNEIKGAERDGGCEKRLNGRLATKATTLGAGGELGFETSRHLPGTLSELVEEELVFESQIADATHRWLGAGVGEHERDLQANAPARQNRNFELAAQVGDPARRAFFVVDSKLELAVEERSTRDEGIDELAIDVVRVLGPNDRGGPDDQSGEQCRDEDDDSRPQLTESTETPASPGRKM